MSKLIATLVATLFAATAFAQTNATPPFQPRSRQTKDTHVAARDDDADGSGQAGVG